MGKVKLYLEPALLPAIHQLADYATCYDDPTITKIIITESLSLNGQQLEQYQTVFSQGLLQNLPQRIAMVGQFVASLQPDYLEIHSSLSRTTDIVLPLLKLLPGAIDPSRMHLHLWDDGPGCMLQRQRFAVEKEQVLLETKATTLNRMRNALKGEAIVGIDNNYACYLWEEFVPTSWHFLAPDPIPDAFRRIFERAAENCTAMTADLKNRLTAAQFTFLCALFTLPAGLVDKLAQLARHPDSVLFIGTCRQPGSFSLLHHQALVRKIDQLRQDGRLPSSELILFKGHPDNREYNRAILAALGEHAVALPENIPPEVLDALNLLPSVICGCFDAAFFTLPHKSAAFILLNEDETYQQTAEHVALLRQTRWLEATSIDFLYESSELKKKRIVYIDASLGDMLFALGAIKALKAQDPRPVTLVVHERYQAIARRSPWVDEVLSIEKLTPHHRQQIAISQEWGMLHVLSGWSHVTAPMHMTDAFLRDFHLEAPALHKNIELIVKKSDARKVDQFLARHRLSGNGIVLLHANRGAANRTWTSQEWNRLAEMLIDAGWKVITIGNSNNKNAQSMFTLSVAGVVDAVDAFNVMETLCLMKKSRLLVACDSGPVAMAGATDIAICAIYSQIKSAYRLPYRHGEAQWNATGIDVGCEFAGCGQYITDEAFHQARSGHSVPVITGSYFANWCPAGGEYACLKNLRAEDVFEQLSELW